MEWFTAWAGTLTGLQTLVLGVLLLLLTGSIAAIAAQRYRNQLANLQTDYVPGVFLAMAGLLWGLLVVSLTLGLFGLIFIVLFQELPDADTEWDWRFRLAQITALTAVLGALAALPITLNRLRLQREDSETAKASLFNEKINAATTDL